MQYIYIFLFLTFLFIIEDSYKKELLNNKKEYYNCYDINKKIFLNPITKYDYLKLKNTSQINNLKCTKANYTKYYVKTFFNSCK